MKMEKKIISLRWCLYVLSNIWSSKLVSTIFYQISVFHQMTALQKLWKTFFISSKKLFLFLRYSNFCISVFLSFFPVSHCFGGWFKKNLSLWCHELSKWEVNNTFCLISWEWNKVWHWIEYWIQNIFMEKSCRKCAPKASLRPLLNFAK